MELLILNSERIPIHDWSLVEQNLGRLEQATVLQLHREDDSFLQVIGEKNRLSIQLARWEKGELAFYLIGLAKRQQNAAEISYPGGILTVQHNELLQFEDAALLFRCFYEDTPFPDAYEKRAWAAA